MTVRAAPLLLLPGLLCDDRVWAEQVAAFEGAVAVPGYGDADSLIEMARRALALAPGHFSLVGHSMGARVALEVYRMAPERVERLAMLSTGVHNLKPGEPENREALLEIGRKGGIEALLDVWLPPMVRPDVRGDAAIMAPMRAMCRSGGMAQAEAQIHALVTRPEVESLLPGLDFPVLVATGRQDEWSPIPQHEAMATMIPGAELVIFEDCGHMAPMEAPEQVNRALARWLARVPAHA